MSQVGIRSPDLSWPQQIASCPGNRCQDLMAVDFGVRDKSWGLGASSQDLLRGQCLRASDAKAQATATDATQTQHRATAF
eukprot:1460314-Amphidinium_carterae.1